MSSKRIRTRSDLAQNGARPAFDEPLHVGRPNIGDRDMFLRLTSEMLDRRWLSNNGPLVKELERRISIKLGVKHCVAMSNGTVALQIAIRALNLKDEVIVPSFTFIATAHALFWQGITPVFADIDAKTHVLDPDAVRRLITPRTTGIIAVHLWGNAAPTGVLQEIADQHGLKILYDAAHAFGCSHKRSFIGSFGEAEVFSFHATKFYNTFEGGAVTTNNDELAGTMRLMRNFGFAGFDNVAHVGTNGKMTEVCAAMGLANLEASAIDRVIAANKRNYEAYRLAFAGMRGFSILDYNAAELNNYQYVILEVGPEAGVTRDDIVAALHAENILARKYFWPGCHRMSPYRELFPYSSLLLPNTEAVAGHVVVLPTGSTLPESAPQTVAAVCRALEE